MDEIKKQAEQCRKCNLATTRTNLVFGEGNLKTEVMFIGEAPGKNEDLQGKPFVGQAGKFLEDLLSEIKLTRKDVFIANVLKCRPPSNRDPMPKEVDACFPYLKEQIRIIKPELICLLGRHATMRFIANARISEIHGRPKRKAGQVYLPLYHPAAALYNGSMKEVLKKDFKKIPLVLEKIREEKEKTLKQTKLLAN